MIWEPFVLALVLGVIVSAGLYFAYLWPHVEPEGDGGKGEETVAPVASASHDKPVTSATHSEAERTPVESAANAESAS